VAGLTEMLLAAWTVRRCETQAVRRSLAAALLGAEAHRTCRTVVLIPWAVQGFTTRNQSWLLG